MHYIIGIDDTDNLESRGTGHLARVLSESLEKEGLAKQHSIVRHQLLVDSRIPYTSHNSSASIVADILCDIKKIIQFCRQLLITESAEGSDVGLCIAAWDDITGDVIRWGNSAKTEVLKKTGALMLVECRNIYLEGLRGTKDGIIGALAAVGLRKEGNDGRVLWLRGMREINGVFRISELKSILNIENIVDNEWREVDHDSLIYTGEWLRPVMRNGKITLIAERINNTVNYNINNSINYEWQVASKEFIKSISE